MFSDILAITNSKKMQSSMTDFFSVDAKVDRPCVKDVDRP